MTIISSVLSRSGYAVVQMPRTEVWGSASTIAIIRKQLSPWDAVFLGGQQLPGVCRVSGRGVEHEIDIKKHAGTNGAKFTDLGRTVAKFHVTLVLSSQKDWDDFEDLVPGLQPLAKDTGQLNAIDVVSPQLNVLGIRKVYVTCVGIPEPGRERGTFEVKLECLEWRKPIAMKGSGTPDNKSVQDWKGKTGDGYPPRARGDDPTKRPSARETGP